MVPIHKKGPKLDYTNYRPINICTSNYFTYIGTTCKSPLKAYLELDSLFCFRQSGFREHQFCQTALIKIIDDWLSAINENKIASLLFLDFSKAFELVDHKLLIHKLKLYNIDTFQQTHYADAISDKKEVLCPKDMSLGQYSSWFM